jgi:hypothetical protein
VLTAKVRKSEGEKFSLFFSYFDQHLASKTEKRQIDLRKNSVQTILKVGRIKLENCIADFNSSQKVVRSLRMD